MEYKLFFFFFSFVSIEYMHIHHDFLLSNFFPASLCVCVCECQSSILYMCIVMNFPLLPTYVNLSVCVCGLVLLSSLSLSLSVFSNFCSCLHYMVARHSTKEIIKMNIIHINGVLTISHTKCFHMSYWHASI